jgi:hypothetical protein
VYRSRNASHYAVARCLAAQADCFARQGKYQDAEPIFRYVLAKWPGWPGLPAVSKSYASLLRATDRRVETRFSNTRP